MVLKPCEQANMHIAVADLDSILRQWRHHKIERIVHVDVF